MANTTNQYTIAVSKTLSGVFIYYKMRLFILDMLTTKFCLFYDLLVNSYLYTDFHEFVVIGPKLFRVWILLDRRMCQFMYQNMEDFIRTTIQTYCDFGAFIDIESYWICHHFNDLWWVWVLRAYETSHCLFHANDLWESCTFPSPR